MNNRATYLIGAHLKRVYSSLYAPVRAAQVDPEKVRKREKKTPPPKVRIFVPNILSYSSHVPDPGRVCKLPAISQWRGVSRLLCAQHPLVPRRNLLASLWDRAFARKVSTPELLLRTRGKL